MKIHIHALDSGGIPAKEIHCPALGRGVETARRPWQHWSAATLLQAEARELVEHAERS